MNAETKRTFTVTQYGEARTGTGNLVGFSSEPRDLETIKAAMALTRVIQPAQTHLTNTGHGAYEQASRYNLKQHRYAGGGSGYFEILEVLDAPQGRHPIVLHARPYWDKRSFSEWNSVEEALVAFEHWFSSADAIQAVRELPGFIRHVDCGMLMPWFYAVGEEGVVGDYALPVGIEDDPVYRLGRKFVFMVYTKDARNRVPVVMTCLGCRLQEIRPRWNGDTPEPERFVQWDDGSITEVSLLKNVRPLREDEEWIEEAVSKFRSFLTGAIDAFELPLLDGTVFKGRFRTSRKVPTAEGTYALIVHLKGKRKPEEGDVEFTPTVEAPDLLSYVKMRFAEKGQTVTRIQVLHAYKRGRKWRGVWQARET